MKKSDPPIIVEQSFSNSIEDVWDAITNVDKMRQWFFNNIPDFKPEVGFKTQFIVQLEDRVFPHLWTIVEVVSNSKITYDWRYEGYPGIGLVSFELSQNNDQTLLQVTSIVTEDFPQDIPEFKRESGIAGWNYFIRDSLKSYMEKPQ